MRKPIFESKEEAINFIENCIAFKGDIENLNISKSLLLIKSKGYIRRNPVEEAEEMRKDLWNRGYFDCQDSVILKYMDKQHEAIQYLEKHIVELNKKVGEI